MVNIFLCDDNPLQLRCVHDFIESYMANKSARIFDYSSPADLLPGLGEYGADIARPGHQLRQSQRHRPGKGH